MSPAVLSISLATTQNRSHTVRCCLAMCFLLLGLLTRSSVSHAQEEPLFEQLRKAFQQDYFSVGILLQSVTDVQVERTFTGANGFSIANARLNVAGNLDGGFGYLLTTNFVSSPAILDARASYRVGPELTITAGQFKTPFSAEFLTYAGSIDFVNRSQVVSSLAPGRQIGIQVGGGIAQNDITYSIGVFNGNGISANGNDGNDFLYAGRLTVNAIRRPSQPTYLEIGVNAAHSKDTDAAFAGGLLQRFNGKRTLVGGDFSLVTGPLSVSGEYIYSRFQSSDGSRHDPHGLHATTGYRLGERSQVLLRLDSFFADGLQSDSHLIIAGYNLWPTQVTELQINYIVPTSGAGFKNHQLLINAQLGF